MKRFKNYISEEVLPTVEVADGSIDIENPSVRGQINNTLVAVTTQPAVTPYVVLQRIMKALAYFHIILPKKTFMGGDKGVEVYEVHQFGHRMGMTDQGEFVTHVPEKFYLFIHYSTMEPFGVTYAKPVVGGMYRVDARLVDADELEKLMSLAQAHSDLHEECGCDDKATASQRMAPKEMMKDVTSDEKKKGNKEAVADSEKGLKEANSKENLSKLAADAMKKGHPVKKIEPGRAEGSSLRKTMAKGFNIEKGRWSGHGKFGLDEEQIDELHGKGSLGKIKGHHEKEARKSYNKGYNIDKRAPQGYDDESTEKRRSAHNRSGAAEKKAEYHWGQSERASGLMSRLKPKTGDDPLSSRSKSKGLVTRGSRKGKPYAGDQEQKKIQIRHALGKHKKANLPEETLDEGMPSSVIKHKQTLANMSDKEFAEKHGHKTEKDLRDMAARHGYGWNKATKTGSDHYVRRVAKAKQVEEEKKPKPVNLTPRQQQDKTIPSSVASYAEKIYQARTKQLRAPRTDYSKNVSEDNLDEAMSSVKRSYGLRKLKRKVNTQVRTALGKERDEKTVLVTNKGDPAAAGGGGVHRIPKSKYDPTKHNRASE